MAHFAFVVPYDQYALGARTLSSVLKQLGHSVSLIILKTVHHNRDPENLQVADGYHAEQACCSETEYSLVRDLLLLRHPDFIGLSFSSPSFGLAAWLTERFHEDFPEVPVVWGGVDATLNPELAIKHADYVFVGEAEETLPVFVDKQMAGGDVSDIPGLWTEKDGRSIRNPPAQLIQDLDRIPFPDFTLENKYLVEENAAREVDYHYFVIMTQRGCPFRCSFCANSQLAGMYEGQKYLRRRSVENVIAELRAVRKLHPNLEFIEFYDDIFTVNKSWLRTFAERYRSEVNLPFWCYTYPGVCDGETADLLKQAGVAFVQVGIQSGSQRTLREVFRRVDPGKVSETARILSDRGIPGRYDLIAGNPFETEQDHLESLEVLLEIPHPFRMNPINPLTFFENTPITRMAKDGGIPLRRIEGANAYYAEDQKEYSFWKSLYQLPQYPQLEKDFIRSLTRGGHFRSHPLDLEAMVSGLERLYWHTASFCSTKEEYTHVLEDRLSETRSRLAAAQARLTGIEGKYLYKVYRKARRFVFGEE